MEITAKVRREAELLCCGVERERKRGSTLQNVLAYVNLVDIKYTPQQTQKTI